VWHPGWPLQATIDAWYMDDAPEDQRLPHRKVPNEPASMEKLAGTSLHFGQTSVWGFQGSCGVDTWRSINPRAELVPDGQCNLQAEALARG